MHEGEFQGSEGTVFYRRWEPDSPPVRIVQIVHGYAEHGGHGRSDGERALLTLCVGGPHEVLSDINRDEMISDLASWIDPVA